MNVPSKAFIEAICKNLVQACQRAGGGVGGLSRAWRALGVGICAADFDGRLRMRVEMLPLGHLGALRRRVE